MADPQKFFNGTEYRPLMSFFGPGYQPAKECCCTPPADCCLYPAPDPDGFDPQTYPATDLPNTIVFLIDGNSVVLTRSGYTFTNGYVILDVIGLAWRARVGGISSLEELNCLVNPPGGSTWTITLIDPTEVESGVFVGPGTFSASSEDEFPDTLTATYGGYDPITIYRASAEYPTICQWYGEGIGTEENPYQLLVEYDSATYKWRVRVWNPDETDGGPKDDPQDTPEGYYPDIDITIAP